MTECVRCGTIEDKENEVMTGQLAHQNETMCNFCRAEELEEVTTLSKREAEVAALKQLGGYAHASISNFLDIDKSTVDEYSRRIANKLETADSTINELNDLR